jgi:EpsI family protein
MNNKIFIIVAVILVAIAIIVNKPQKFDSTNEAEVANFPKVIGEWQGRDISIPERDYEILETRNLFIRNYKNLRTGEVVNFYIIYSGIKRKSLHPPEICYTGGGATITEKSVIPITNSIMANEFAIKTKNSHQLIVYWFKSTNLNTYSYLKQQLKIVTDQMRGKKTSGALIRVSTDIKDGNQDAALKLIKEFCGKVELLLEKYVP